MHQVQPDHLNAVKQGNKSVQENMRYSKMRYSLTEVNVDNQHEGRLKNAIENNKATTIRIFLTEPRKMLLLTKGQIMKIECAQILGKDRISIKLTVPQIKANIEHSGGFLWELARAVGSKE